MLVFLISADRPTGAWATWHEANLNGYRTASRSNPVSTTRVLMLSAVQLRTETNMRWRFFFKHWQTWWKLNRKQIEISSSNSSISRWTPWAFFHMARSLRPGRRMFFVSSQIVSLLFASAQVGRHEMSCQSEPRFVSAKCLQVMSSFTV